MTRPGALLLITLLAAACGSLWPAERMRGRSETGFLSTYANLSPDPRRPDVLVWHLSGIDLADYTAALVQEPVLRRRPDDQLPSPADRDALCRAVQASVQDALRQRLTIVEDVDPNSPQARRVMRVKLAVTTALMDRGDLPPEGECQRWATGPTHFALECEVVDGADARPIAKLIAWDRRRTVECDQPTPWHQAWRNLGAWADDVAWLVQPPAGAAAAGGVADGAAPAPVSTYTSST